MVDWYFSEGLLDYRLHLLDTATYNVLTGNSCHAGRPLWDNIRERGMGDYKSRTFKCRS